MQDILQQVQGTQRTTRLESAVEAALQSKLQVLASKHCNIQMRYDLSEVACDLARIVSFHWQLEWQLMRAVT